MESCQEERLISLPSPAISTCSNHLNNPLFSGFRLGKTRSPNSIGSSIIGRLALSDNLGSDSSLIWGKELACFENLVSRPHFLDRRDVCANQKPRPHAWSSFPRWTG
jgi:hypothetical protein